MKALQPFIKPSWGTIKKCENKHLLEIHFGEKSRVTQNKKD